MRQNRNQQRRLAVDDGFVYHLSCSPQMVTRVPCKSCGAEILPVTAEATGGICMACKQGIRRGPVDRNDRLIEDEGPTAENEKVTIAPNGHIHISRDDGSSMHINVSRIQVSAGDSFLCQLQNMAELRKRVTNLIVTGKAADLEKSDLEPLMRLWIKGLEAEKSSDTSSQFILGPRFSDEFKSLSTILTASGIDLNQFSTAALSPGPAQDLPQPPQRSYRYWILPLTMALFLGVGIGIDGVDYSFFVVLRFAVCASFSWWAWRAHERRQSIWRNVFVLTAVFYNPFVPLRLDREWWQVVNGLTIAIILIAAAKNKLGEQNSGSNSAALRASP